MLKFATAATLTLLTLTVDASKATLEKPPEPTNSSAATEKTQPAQPNASIQPRNSGAKWIYKSTGYVDGKIDSTITVLEKVIETKTIDKTTCYKIQLTFDWRSIMERLSGVKLTPDDYSEFWEYDSEQGSYNFSGNDENDGPVETPTSLEQFELTLPYPVEKGHRYIAEGDAYEVIATDRTIEVHAGTFPCVVYQTTYDEDPEYITRQRLFMSPGVGLVRWEEDEKAGKKWQLIYRDDLFSYDLNEPEMESDPEPKSTKLNPAKNPAPETPAPKNPTE